MSTTKTEMLCMRWSRRDCFVIRSISFRGFKKQRAIQNEFPHLRIQSGWINLGIAANRSSDLWTGLSGNNKTKCISWKGYYNKHSRQKGTSNSTVLYILMQEWIIWDSSRRWQKNLKLTRCLALPKLWSLHPKMLDFLFSLLPLIGWRHKAPSLWGLNRFLFSQKFHGLFRILTRYQPERQNTKKTRKCSPRTQIIQFTKFRYEKSMFRENFTKMN